MGLESVESKYLDGRTVMNCSDVTAADVDKEVMEILKESYEKAKQLLLENRSIMDKLAEFLIEKETITGKEFMQIFRREKGIPEPEEEKKEEKPQEQKLEDISLPREKTAEDNEYGQKPQENIPEIGQNFSHTIDEPLGRFSQAPSGLEHPVGKDDSER